MPSYTSRLQLPTPLSTEPPNGPADFGALNTILDNLAGPYAQGILANRPVSTSGSPGIQGRIYQVIGDSTPSNNGVVWLDYGTGWIAIAPPSTVTGTRATMPAASTVAVGTRYFATDQYSEWICVVVSSVNTWLRVGPQPGEIGINLTSNQTPGKLLLQGQAWPSTTGIYADLYAWFGSPGSVPDFRTYVPAGFKSGDATFGTLGQVQGATAVGLSTAQMPSHNHGVNDPTHAHSDNGHAHPFSYYNQGGDNLGSYVACNSQNDYNNATISGAVGTGYASIAGAYTGISIQNNGSGATHPNLQPTITINFEAKL